MNRREFSRKIAGLSLVLGNLPAGCGLPTQEPLAAQKESKRSESVLIIGAGVAGLAAAERLRFHGLTDVTLLESRDRVGGRVHTSSLWPDAPMDLGGSWIHGTRGNPITRLAREAKTPTRATDFENIAYFGADGTAVGTKSLRALEGLSMEVYRRALNPRTARGTASLKEALEPLYSSASPEGAAKLDYLIHAVIEQDLAENVDQLSARAYTFGEEFGGPDVLFPEGYMSVFAARFAKLDIRTEQAAQSIEWRANGVSVETEDQSFEADRVILTVPLGVLKQDRIAFRPGLPESKRAAIRSLGMGCLNKVYLRFPETFWPKGYDGFSYQSPQAGQWSQWLDMRLRQNAPPVLLAFNAGSFARELESWTDSDIVESAMGALRKLFGASIPQPEGHQITRWASDPHAFGSYSTLAPGYSSSTIEALGAPVGDRLYFAGEATNAAYPSTVHGAYLSGIREADRLARSL